MSQGHGARSPTFLAVHEAGNADTSAANHVAYLRRTASWAHDALCYGAKQRCRIPYATRRHGGVDVGNDNSLCASIESARGPELGRACGRRAVIRGEYGVGAACRNVLGARCKTVQRRVNQMLRWTIYWHGIESPGVLSFVSRTVPFAESVWRHFYLRLSLSMCLLLWEGLRLWISDSV